MLLIGCQNLMSIWFYIVSWMSWYALTVTNTSVVFLADSMLLPSMPCSCLPCCCPEDIPSAGDVPPDPGHGEELTWDFHDPELTHLVALSHWILWVIVRTHNTTQSAPMYSWRPSEVVVLLLWLVPWPGDFVTESLNRSLSPSLYSPWNHNNS